MPTTTKRITLTELSKESQLVLYTLKRLDEPVTYTQLGTATGFSRAALRRCINAEDRDTLSKLGLVSLSYSESDPGYNNSKLVIELTPQGKALVS